MGKGDIPKQHAPPPPKGYHETKNHGLKVINNFGQNWFKIQFEMSYFLGGGGGGGMPPGPIRDGGVLL